jgi:hypothetical protein
MIDGKVSQSGIEAKALGTDDQPNLFSRLKRLVGRVFPNPQIPTKNIQEFNVRVEEMKLNINRTVAYLKAVQIEMELLDDDQLKKHASNLLTPLIRDLIQFKDFNEDSKEFNKWIQKASLWVRLTKKPIKEEALWSTLIQHSVGEAVESVEQDVNIVSVYLHHRIGALKLSDEEREELVHGLEEKIQPYFEKLHILAHAFRPTTIAELILEKNSFNEKRENYHEEVLSVIDGFLKSY